MALAALLIAIAAGLGTRSAHAIGWLPVGPYGGASVFAPDPTEPSRAYAAVGHVLYRTGDAGAHYRIVQRFDPSSPITLIAPAFNRPGPLYVTTGRHTWKSMDGGMTFSRITPAGADDELRVVASSARLGHVFAYQRLGGFSFSGALPDDAGSVCRFYGTPGVGPNSHFHTIFPEECDAVARDNGWTLESRAILISGLPSTTCTASGCVSSCIATRTSVRRLYNSRAGFNDSNHRYTTDPDIYAAMQASGWVGEGVVFCSP